MIAAAIACLGISLSVMLYAISQGIRGIELQLKTMNQNRPDFDASSISSDIPSGHDTNTGEHTS